MMRKVVSGRIAALAVLCLIAVSACSSDGDDESSFRNLGKRGDSDVTAGHAAAVAK